jgi:hypothetical protein
MRKVYKKLTEEQKTRGVIFSSCLSVYRTEQKTDTIHEVKKEDTDKDLTISRLLNDSFFNESHFKYNIIRR